jgi:hypothetical protein
MADDAWPWAPLLKLVLDAGAFIAFERGDRMIAALLKRELLARRRPRTHGGVVGQIWRGGARQARVARLLQAIEVVALDLEVGRRAGLLLGRTRQADVVDSAVVLLASDDDWLVTSDPDDLRPLAQGAGLHVEIVPV